MPESFALDPTNLFLTIIISGGIVAGIFEGLRSWLTQNREEKMDITKIKMEKISNGMPYYNKLIYFFNSITNYSDYVTKEANTGTYIEYSKEFSYFFGKVLNLQDQYFKKFGSIQLDCIQAETVLTEILNMFNRNIRRKIGSKNLSILRTDLVRYQNHYFSYHEFEYVFAFNSELKERIEQDLLSDDETMETLRNLSSYFVDIMALELNHNFRIWYGEEQDITELSPKTIIYIISNHPSYYKRIRSLNRPRLLQPSTWIK